MLDDEANIVMLVLFGNRHIPTVGDQVNDVCDTKLLVLDRERLRDNISDVVLKHPAERLVVVWVKGLHVLDGNGLAKDALVDSSAEVAVEDSTFVQRLANDAANEFEERQMLVVDTAELVGMESCAIRRDGDEKSVVGIKHLPRKNLEPFPSDTACIDSLFIVEANVEFTKLHLVAGLEVQRSEGVVEHLLAAH